MIRDGIQYMDRTSGQLDQIIANLLVIGCSPIRQFEQKNDNVALVHAGKTDTIQLVSLHAVGFHLEPSEYINSDKMRSMVLVKATIPTPQCR